MRIAGIDGAPGDCWAVVIIEAGRPSIRKVTKLSDFVEGAVNFKVIAIDVPIGLLDAYEVGGRDCDRAARKLLSRLRGSEAHFGVNLTHHARARSESRRHTGCQCSMLVGRPPGCRSGGQATPIVQLGQYGIAHGDLVLKSEAEKG